MLRPLIDPQKMSISGTLLQRYTAEFMHHSTLLQAKTSPSQRVLLSRGSSNSPTDVFCFGTASQGERLIATPRLRMHSIYDIAAAILVRTLTILKNYSS